MTYACHVILSEAKDLSAYRVGILRCAQNDSRCARDEEHFAPVVPRSPLTAYRSRSI